MKLKSLVIKKMPGFLTRELSLHDLSDGLNLIEGSNGAGKTSFGRAIMALLWPDSARGLRPLLIESVWEAGGESFTVALEASGKRPVRTVYPPECARHLEKLPSALYARSFHLSIDDLFAADDADFSHLIQNQMQGGLDINLIRGSFTLPKFHGRSEWKALLAAKKELQLIRQQHVHLEAERERMGALGASIERAGRAGDELQRHLRALEHQSLARKKSEIEQELATFPQKMEAFHSKSLDEYRAFEEDIFREGTRIESLLGERDELQKKMPELQLAGLCRADIEECAVKAKELVRVAEESAFLDGELESNGVALSHECALLQCEPHFFDHCSPPILRVIETLLQKRASLLLHLNEFKARLASFLPVLCQDEELVRDKLTLLRNYKATKRLILPLCALFLLGLLTLGWVGEPILQLAGAILLLPLAKVGFDFLLLKKRIGPFEGSSAELEVELADILRAKSERVVGSEIESRIAGLQEEVELVNGQIAQCESECGLVFSHYEALGSLFFDGVRRIKEITISSEKLLLKKKANEKRSSLLLEGGEPLSPPKNPQARAYFFENLLKKIDEQQQMSARLEGVEKDLIERGDDLKRTEVKLAEFLARHGIEGDVQEQLDMRSAGFPRFQLLEKNYGEIVTKISLLEGSDGSIGEIDSALIEERIAHFRKESEGLSPLIEERARLALKIEQALASCDLEEALFAVKEAERALKMRWEEALFAESGKFLLERAEKQSEMSSEHLAHASKLFEEITAGRYRLSVNRDDGGHFFAYDTRDHLYLSIDQLSRGSRIQLIIAVRLAFASSLEQSVAPLPLIFDEALSHSDPVRFEALANAICRLASSGRQIFYLTCQSSELQLLLAKREGAESISLIALADAHELVR